VYSRLYYEKLRATVEEKVEESTPEGEETADKKRGRIFGIQREVVASAFAEESPEVKAEVAEQLAALKSAKAALALEKKKALEDTAEDERDLTEMVQYVFICSFFLFLIDNHVSGPSENLLRSSKRSFKPVNARLGGITLYWLAVRILSPEGLLM
jgi:hypothetical protein